ncbi:DUF983 domain-containing protein [Devosia faecipullorum]|uniref:DUF983 domain-containing protein n=1 Tax=Devosia faecipullorum TaxID=2755039 RepID=UPI00187B46D4|nr:DUF983 domain-containing protein [Devosia faecipullorum]MBE7734087.1 DUF983 domain-containing protein [Devosia faecipullorum]
MPKEVDLRQRPAWSAIGRGIRCKCPNCGQGWLFHHYIEQVENCAHCGEPLAYYKAGLFLPFVVITLVIHVVAVVMLRMEVQNAGSPLFYLYVLVPLTLVLTLAILPSSKGAILGLMWAKGWSDEQDK